MESESDEATPPHRPTRRRRLLHEDARNVFTSAGQVLALHQASAAARRQHQVPSEEESQRSAASNATSLLDILGGVDGHQRSCDESPSEMSDHGLVNPEASFYILKSRLYRDVAAEVYGMVNDFLGMAVKQWLDEKLNIILNKTPLETDDKSQSSSEPDAWPAPSEDGISGEREVPLQTDGEDLPAAGSPGEDGHLLLDTTIRPLSPKLPGHRIVNSSPDDNLLPTEVLLPTEAEVQSLSTEAAEPRPSADLTWRQPSVDFPANKRMRVDAGISNHATADVVEPSTPPSESEPAVPAELPDVLTVVTEVTSIMLGLLSRQHRQRSRRNRRPPPAIVPVGRIEQLLSAANAADAMKKAPWRPPPDALKTDVYAVEVVNLDEDEEVQKVNHMSHAIDRIIDQKLRNRRSTETVRSEDSIEITEIVEIPAETEVIAEETPVVHSSKNRTKDELIAELLSQLECPLCYRSFGRQRDPRRLSSSPDVEIVKDEDASTELRVTRCGHLFCLDCIERHIRTSSTKRSSCPICNQPISAATLAPLYF